MAEPKVKRMNINVEASLHNAFKAAAALQGKEMTEVLLEFLKSYVRQHKTGAPRKGRRQ